jgi:hypothetical protein
MRMSLGEFVIIYSAAGLAAKPRVTTPRACSNTSTCFCPSQLVRIPHTNLLTSFFPSFFRYSAFTTPRLLSLRLSYLHLDPCPSSDDIVAPTLTKLRPTIMIPTLTMTSACAQSAQLRQP